MLLASTLVAGCDYLGYLAYVFHPRPTKYVESAFDVKTGHSLEGKSVAVLIYVEEEIKLDYGRIPQTLGRWTRAMMEYNEESEAGIKDLRVIHPDAVVSYMVRNPNWDSIDKRKIARDLKADYLIFVPLTDYTTRIPGTIDAYRGTISGEVEVFDAKDTAEIDDPLFVAKDPIEIVFPENPDKISYNRRSEQIIQVEMEKRFATAVAKLFYAREESALTDDERYTEPRESTPER